MNKYEAISNIISTMLGINIGVFALELFSLPSLIETICKVVFYVLGIASLFLTIYYKFQNGKLEVENKKLKKQQDEDDSNGVFKYYKDYSKEE